MKEIKNYRHYFAIGNEEYYDTSIWDDLHYCESKRDKVFELNTFEEVVQAIENGLIHQAEVGRTFFGNKPMIILHTDDLYGFKIKMTEKNFKPVRVKHTWEDYKQRITINSLAKELPADEFCEYLKDRGIFQISIKNLQNEG
ncbi:MAG: hypothetical protein IJZ62_04040 [Clostridia bacterium]|nr:hypothetical protein [Clostridia bacterium]